MLTQKIILFLSHALVIIIHLVRQHGVANFDLLLNNYSDYYFPESMLHFKQISTAKGKHRTRLLCNNFVPYFQELTRHA